jgi:hypothetical protein
LNWVELGYRQVEDEDEARDDPEVEVEVEVEVELDVEVEVLLVMVVDSVVDLDDETVPMTVDNARPTWPV